MISPLRFLAAAVFASALLAPAVSSAQDDLTPPYVASGISDLTVGVNPVRTRIDLSQIFNLAGAEGTVARFDTTLGAIDVLLRDDVAPQTVQNFLYYVNNSLYNGSFIHRSVAGFIWQGGGYVFDASGNVDTIPTQAPVPNEFNLSNVRGTLAMAKLGSDPNSATDQWFFNEADNSANLDTQNGGFTVFGQVITNGLDVMDTISAVPVYAFASPFDQLPLVNYDGTSNVQAGNFVTVNSVAIVPVLPQTAGAPSLLTAHVAGNDNPSVLRAYIAEGHILTLVYTGAKGSAKVTVSATDTAGTVVKTHFTVTKR